MSLSNLNFEVILNDKDFNTKVKADIELAEKLNTQLSRLLTAQSKLGGAKTLISAKGVENAEKMSALLTEISGKMGSLPNNVKLVDATIKRTTTNVTSMNTSLSGTAGILRTISQLTGTAFSIIGLRRLISDLVEVTGNLELQKESMTHILGSAEKGTVIFEQLKELAKPSYFTLPDLTKYAKQLAALSIPYEELFETTKMLGDVSAGLGVSFDRIALAYGHIRSMGFLRGMQARQLTNAGIPIFEELAKNLSEVEKKSVSISDVYDRMAKRMITFEQVKEVFVQMTSEGGKFYDMQIAMTDTLAGRVNKLKGVWEIALSELGNEKSGLLKGTINAMIALVGHLTTIGRIITPLIASVGAYGAAMLVAFAADKINAVYRTAKYFILLTQRTDLATAAMRVFGSATKAVATGVGALALAGVAIYEWLVKPAIEAKKAAKDVTTAISKGMAEMNAEQRTLKNTFDKLEKATYGTKEYADARQQLLNKYGDHLTAIDRENIAIGNLKAVYDSLAVSIEDAARARLLDTQTSKIETDLADKQGKILDKIYKLFPRISDEHYSELAGYIMGTRSKDSLSEGALNYFDAIDAVTGQAIFGVEGLREEYKKAAEDAEAAIKRIQDAFNPKKTVEEGGPLDFQKIVDEQIGKISDEKMRERMQLAFGYGNEKDWDNYRDSISKKYNELTEQLAGAFSVERRKPLQEEINFIRTLDKAFGGHLLAGNKTVNRQNKDAEQANREAVRDIEKEVAILERYKRAYDEFEPMFGEGTGKFLTQFFAGTTASTFNTLDWDLKQYIADLRELGELGEEAADKIETRLGMDALSVWKKADAAAKKSQANMEKYQTYYRKWYGEDFNLSGKGAEFDLRKILSDYNSNIGKVDEKYTKGVELAREAHKGNAHAIAEEIKKLGDLRDAESKYFAAQRDEKIRDLAKTIFNEQMSGYDLSNWSDKNLSQLREIREALANLSVPDEIKELLSEEQLEELEEILKAMGRKKIDNTVDPETSKAWADGIQKGAKFLSKASSAMRSIANATKDASVAAMADAAGALSQNLSAAAEGYQMAQSMGAGAYSWIGAVAGGLLDILTQAMDYTAEQTKRMDALADSIRNVHAEAERARFDKMMDSNTIFGDNYNKSLRGVLQTITEARQKMADAIGLRDTMQGPNEHSFENYFQNFIRDALVQYGGFSSEFADVASIVLRKSQGGWWDKWWNTENAQQLTTLMEAADELGYSLFDEKYGILNVDLLKAIKSTYDLTEGQREFIDAALEGSEAYIAAMKKVDEMAQQVFGDIAGSAADKIIDSWIEAGNAALDYADILDDVARAYAKMLIQSTILDTAFDEKTTDAIKEAFMSGNYEGAMGMIADAMEAVEKAAPIYEQILSAFDPYFQTSDEANSLGSGIKGITEDTASLLASYINAIRADVSAMRGLQENGFRDLAALSERIPTLTDYLQEIAATNYDTAQNTNRILTELQSVIGAPGTNGMVVRVEQV